MASADPIWERFVGCKLSQAPSFVSQNSDNNSILGSRSINLTSGSIALHADASAATLMRDLAVKPVTELLSGKASQELASRNRYVDFVRLVLSCCVADASGREKKAAVAVKALEAIHSGLVVDKPAHELQNVLLTELDDINPDHVPLIVDAILAPLLVASRRRSGSFATGRLPQPPAASMGDTAAAGFLVALDILPKVLGLTAGVPALSEEAPVPEDCRGLSGALYKERVVSRLFRARWPGAVSIGMCQVLRDLDLEEEQLQVAVARVLRHLRKNAKLHDLPPLTYQLLLLAGRKCKEAALEGVIRVFDRLDAAAEAADREDAAAADDHIPMRRGSRLGASSTEELRLVEGTILLHFNFAMKQDHNLATCVLKGFQRRATAPEVRRAFTPFRLALLLSLSRIQRFSQPVLDLVQDIVSDCLMYDHLRESSAWLEGEEELVRWGRRNGIGGGANRSRAEADEDGSDGEVGGGRGGALGGAELASSAKAVESVLLTVVRSSRGWDHLVGSLLKLGMQLLDRGGAVSAGLPAGAGAAKGMLEKLQGSHTHRASLRASHLGRVVLMETFKTHEIVRRQVLTSVLEQVTARSQGVMGYVKLLGLLAERSPNLLLDDAEAVRDVFGYISILPPPVAERFLLAVAPLLRLRPRLQDSVVLPLRKALFSREERARLVAVGGLVLLLGIQSRSAGADDGRRGAGMHGGTQLSQSSQASQGWSSASMPAPAGLGGSGRALSLAEGFGLLRRCLTQQMVVRAKLYDGLLASFVQGSLEFQLDTISLLAGHLRRFVNLAAAAEGSGASGGGAGGGPPLLLARCLDQSTGDIAEPLPLLIGCLHRMVVSGRASLAEHAGSNNSDGGRADPDSMLDDDVDGQGGAAGTAAGMALLESLDELDGDLRQLSTALSGASLEEFGLDKVADFSPNGGPAARAKLATAALLCGSYEAFMQGSLLLMGRPAKGGRAVMVTPRRRPTSASLRAFLRLFDCRQALLELVRPGLPTPAQQRAKKAAGVSGGSAGSGSSGSVGGSLGGDGESAMGAGGGGAGSGPGFSAHGCFGLTLHPGGMPCLGMAFVEDMLAVLNLEPEEGDDGEETEGDTECDPGVVDVDGRDPSADAVRDDLGLQRLVLETCRGHLRALRTSTAAATAGLMVEIGGSCSAKGAVSASSALGGIHGGPQDEADAARAGKAAVKRCTGLAPLLLKEVIRQLAEGNNSGEAKAAAAAMKTSDANGSKGKAKSGSGGGGGAKGKKKSAPAESLSELALACFEECVCIAAHCSPRARVGASRTGKILAAAYKHLSGSNAPPADLAGEAEVTSVIGKYAGALVQTLTTLIADNQGKEAETVCRILSQLARPLKLEPECLEAYAASLKVVCREQRVNSPVLAKAVVSLYVQAHMSIKAKDGNLGALHDLATQVRACLGLLEEGDEEEEDEPPALSFRIINNYTVASISEVTVGAIEACIDDVEYALRLMHKAALARQARVAAQTPEGLEQSFRHGGGGAGSQQSDGTVSEDGLSSDGSADLGRSSDSDSDAAGVRSDGSSGERDPLDRRETVVCDRLRVVMQTITVLAGTRLEGRSMEKLVSSASRVFRAITKVLKVRLSLKRAYVGLGLKSVLRSKQDFTAALHSLLPHLEDEKGSKVTKNNITRQSRLVPTLIFQMEECDVQLLLLGKLCKGSLDLPRWVSSRVDRDFRIDQNAIAGCQEHSRGLREKRKRKGKAGSSSASKKKSGAQARKNTAAEDGSGGEGGEGEGDKDEEEEEEEEEEEGGGGGAGGNGDEDEDDDEEEDGEDEEGEEEAGG